MIFRTHLYKIEVVEALPKRKHERVRYNPVVNSSAHHKLEYNGVSQILKCCYSQKNTTGVIQISRSLKEVPLLAIVTRNISSNFFP